MQFLQTEHIEIVNTLVKKLKEQRVSISII